MVDDQRTANVEELRKMFGYYYFVNVFVVVIKDTYFVDLKEKKE